MDKQEICNYLEIVCKHSRSVSKIFQEDISVRTEDMPIFVEYLQGSKPTNRQTDTQKICIYLEIMWKHPSNVSKIFQKDMSSRKGDIPILA